MPRKRISMRKIRDVLRLHYREGYSLRATARCVHISVSTVSDYIRRAAEAQLRWPLPEELTDEALQKRLFPKPKKTAGRAVPDWHRVRKEIARKGVTLYNVWEQYRAGEPEGYSYPDFVSFSKHGGSVRRWSCAFSTRPGRRCTWTMRGSAYPSLIQTRARRRAPTFSWPRWAIPATRMWKPPADQKLHNWIASHRRAFEFFGAVPHMVVPDNLKAGVKKAHRYDPELNRTYQELAVHYDVAIPPRACAAPAGQGESRIRCKAGRECGFWRGCATSDSSVSKN